MLDEVQSTFRFEDSAQLGGGSLDTRDRTEYERAYYRVERAVGKRQCRRVCIANSDSLERCGDFPKCPGQYRPIGGFVRNGKSGNAFESVVRRIQAAARTYLQHLTGGATHHHSTQVR